MSYDKQDNVYLNEQEMPTPALEINREGNEEAAKIPVSIRKESSSRYEEAFFISNSNLTTSQDVSVTMAKPDYVDFKPLSDEDDEEENEIKIIPFKSQSNSFFKTCEKRSVKV